MGVDTKKVVLAVGLATFTGVALYLLYKKNDEDDELEMYAADTATSRHTLIEMVIPRNAVGFVIGRQGANVKEIQEITNTRINFKDPGGPTDDRVCVIRGKAENAQEAERLIQRAIAEQPKLLTINISVPQRACGRIIGRNGDSIREMCAVSGAKIIVDREFRTPADGMRLITIKGTEDQLSTAKQLIQTKVEEEEAMQRRIELSAANRAPRTKHKPDAGKSQGAGDQPVPTRESLVATGADGYLEVYVSAVDTPGHFWVQVKSPRAIELDKLVERMTEFYSEESNRNMYKLKKVAVGDVVAAPFPYDSSWYRAEVTELAENDSDPDQTALTVYYVDFGDTDTVQRRQAAELRTDFLGLSHQAVECFLSGVKPSGCSWTDAAGDCFEELTYAAQWKSVMAKVVRYQQAGSRKVPVVELVDTNSELDVDVAKELVKRGHAVWAKSGATGSREASPACCS
ncbi:tudor and KH domain-containing protein homolog isoform X1 [Amphibalanus amphitrite]|uniref:tudor and KH domain-containing protein homolog isoform X1 n=1 Tax=Amphibalanus amphitrite TaxID=1232801 RepID=UPI001C924062|nr:tudor and KH domain-containing protein homolog isoform X1 [Amphibalanus amphitrite]XP_043226498.1 tudor and KH domain-containing protein homolog isoform X1 [Amphibalanus amphitrite]XP_043226499.1 tudor and KH domain-containing protein homolog isoform X1 [Amphibalanus amphitrite]